MAPILEMVIVWMSNLPNLKVILHVDGTNLTEATGGLLFVVVDLTVAVVVVVDMTVAAVAVVGILVGGVEAEALA